MFLVADIFFYHFKYIMPCISCKIIVPLASDICLLVSEVGLKACTSIPLIQGLTGVVVTRVCSGD